MSHHLIHSQVILVAIEQKNLIACLLLQFFSESMSDVFIGLNKILHPSVEVSRMIWGFCFWKAAVASAVTYCMFFCIMKNWVITKCHAHVLERFFVINFRIVGCTQFFKLWVRNSTNIMDSEVVPAMIMEDVHFWRSMHFYWGELIRRVLEFHFD